MHPLVLAVGCSRFLRSEVYLFSLTFSIYFIFSQSLVFLDEPDR